MKWVSALSTRPSLEAALDDVIGQAQQSLNTPADLAILFISTSFSSEYPRLLPLLQERLNVPHVIGCGGNGIIGQAFGTTSEIEEEPALALTLAHLPGVKLQTFQFMSEDLPDPDSSPDRWVDLMQVDPADQPNFILLADAASTKINDLLQGLDYAYPGAVKIGGLTSGPNLSDGSGLFCDRKLYREGAIGVALSGDIQVDTIVAQGCRPVGQPYRVTDAERNVMLQVEEQLARTDPEQLPETGKEQTPLEALQSVVDKLDDDDRELAQHALSVGIVRNEFKQELEPGDFLIRNLIGVDPRIGAVAIGDRIRPGQRIQFHLRDAEASAEDLEALLKKYLRAGHAAPAGVLLFDCLGRGEAFYDQADFDSDLFHRYIKNIPMTGFFCNGEIGPIGGTTFLHGYTAAFGIFSQPSRD
ncbi:MAG: FIST N-terminal domain-containing protein [Thermosynechococcaceae cyanobacterium]